MTNIYHSPSFHVTQTPHVMTIHSHYIQTEMCLYMLVNIMKETTGLVKQQKQGLISNYPTRLLGILMEMASYPQTFFTIMI